MIATITLNPAIDMTMSIPGFAVGRTNRGPVERADPGGKGVNVAMAVREWAPRGVRKARRWPEKFFPKARVPSLCRDK